MRYKLGQCGTFTVYHNHAILTGKNKEEITISFEYLRKFEENMHIYQWEMEHPPCIKWRAEEYKRDICSLGRYGDCREVIFSIDFNDPEYNPYIALEKTRGEEEVVIPLKVGSLKLLFRAIHEIYHTHPTYGRIHPESVLMGPGQYCVYTEKKLESNGLF